MSSKLYAVLIVAFATGTLFSQQNEWDAVSPHTMGIGFTLISTDIERGGGGIGLDYYYTVSEEIRLGIKTHYGFYGYVNNDQNNVQANSMSLMPSMRIFLQDDVFADIDAGIYRENSGIMRERSRQLNNHFSYAIGIGYAIHYSSKVSALIGIRSLTVRGYEFDLNVEHQFNVYIGVAIRILKNK
ncbi:MAG: hypothetical protein ACYC09_00940 [Bacteroidota bacterium]